MLRLNTTWSLKPLWDILVGCGLRLTGALWLNNHHVSAYNDRLHTSVSHHVRHTAHATSETCIILPQLAVSSMCIVKHHQYFVNSLQLARYFF